MRLENSDVAAVFSEMADLLELQDGNPFRIRSFRRAAQVIEALPEHVSTMLEAGTLREAPGVGEGTLARVREILERGDCADHAELRKAVPPGLLEMLRIEGMGPKKVRLVFTELGVRSIDELEAAAMQGHLAQLPRMGEKSQAKLLKAIEAHRRHVGRVLLSQALPQGMALRASLQQVPGALRVELAGSCRRRLETIGDLDLLVAAESSATIMDIFASLPQVSEVMLRGETKCAVRLASGLQVDLRVVSPRCFGAALHYFTGSKMHNIAIRDRGKRRGLRISEYGVFRDSTDELLGGATEEEIFAAVGLPYVPPELRENQGEIEAAEAGRLPRLVTEGDLRGDLHLHTNATDGTASAREMVEAAIALGYQYVAITDHSKAVAVAHGQDETRLAQQRADLRALEQELGALRILAGVEVDILADGTLDLAEAALAPLDWVVASVHSHFNLPEEQMTQRMIRAMESGVVDCIGHPSGRLLGHRDGYAVDLDRLIRAAERLGVAMELNAFPDRLDLDAPHCRQAKECGVPVAINTDAHAARHLAQREFGIATARRGWLEPSDVLNTGSAEAILSRRRDRMRGKQVARPAPVPEEKDTAPRARAKARSKIPPPRGQRSPKRPGSHRKS
jgi:DNA polymerase (family 10)